MYRSYQGSIGANGRGSVEVRHGNAAVEWDVYQISCQCGTMGATCVVILYVNGAFLCATPQGSLDTACGPPDVMGLYVPAQTGFVAPIGGIYLVSCYLRTGQTNNQIYPTVNGTNIGRVSLVGDNQAGWYDSGIPLNANDVMRITLSTNTTGTLLGSTIFNYCTVAYLGTG
jgi:hypothetical protein